LEFKKNEFVHINTLIVCVVRVNINQALVNS